MVKTSAPGEHSTEKSVPGMNTDKTAHASQAKLQAEVDDERRPATAAKRTSHTGEPTGHDGRPPGLPGERPAHAESSITHPARTTTTVGAPANPEGLLPNAEVITQTKTTSTVTICSSESHSQSGGVDAGASVDGKKLGQVSGTVTTSSNSENKGDACVSMTNTDGNAALAKAAAEKVIAETMRKNSIALPEALGKCKALTPWYHLSDNPETKQCIDQVNQMFGDEAKRLSRIAGDASAMMMYSRSTTVTETIKRFNIFLPSGGVIDSDLGNAYRPYYRMQPKSSTDE